MALLLRLVSSYFALLFITCTERAQREFVFIIFLTGAAFVLCVIHANNIQPSKQGTSSKIECHYLVACTFVSLFTLLRRFIIFYVLCDKTQDAQALQSASCFEIVRRFA